MTRSSLARHWPLDPAVTFLNHGSFGSCPVEILRLQSRLRDELESEPVRFLVAELERRLDEARRPLAAFIGANAEDIAFVPNATTGFNAVLRSLPFSPGDELLTTDHAYNAAKTSLEFVAERTGTRVVIANVPFPVRGEDEIVSAILSKVTERTRLALIDHVTSPTAMIFPIERLVRELENRGVDTLVDGAHAPGMLPLDLNALNAAYYTGNLHKWICAPKGAAFLHVRRDRQELIRPTVISHGANSVRKDRSRFLLEFDWPGTGDPSPYLCVPAVIDFVNRLVPGGWPEVMRRNRELALRGRDLLCDLLEIPHPVPDQLIGSIATVPLPEGNGERVLSPLDSDPLQHHLFGEFRIELPIWPWPRPPKRVLRISAYLYNDFSEYQTLGDALMSSLAAKR